MRFLLRSNASIITFLTTITARLKESPVFVFYIYLWKNHKQLFASTVFVNYILQALLEVLPWYLSRRKIVLRLRLTRNEIQHTVISGGDTSTLPLVSYAALSGLHVLLQTVDGHLRNRITLATKLAIKRMLVERVLYAEVWSLRGFRIHEMEGRVMYDIGQTLRLFNDIIPSAIGNAYIAVREGYDLLKERKRLDPLIVARPTAMAILSRVLSWAHGRISAHQQDFDTEENEVLLSQLVSTTLSGIQELQLFNAQRVRLSTMDALIADALRLRQGFWRWVSRTWSAFESRNILDFITEVLVVHKIMRRKGLNHEQYRELQLNIDYVLECAQRSMYLVSRAQTVLQNEARVVNMLRIPVFSDSEAQLLRDVGPFEDICLSGVKFSYDSDGPVSLELDQDIVFERGKRYALVGKNGSGKSTLCALLLKLYSPSEGSIFINGVSYAKVSRLTLRDTISYTSQQPYIFPGTVEDNIRVANAYASEEEVLQAALLAGISIGDSDSDSRSDPGRPSAPVCQADRQRPTGTHSLRPSSPRPEQQDLVSCLLHKESSEAREDFRAESDSSGLTGSGRPVGPGGLGALDRLHVFNGAGVCEKVCETEECALGEELLEEGLEANVLRTVGVVTSDEGLEQDEAVREKEDVEDIVARGKALEGLVEHVLDLAGEAVVRDSEERSLRRREREWKGAKDISSCSGEEEVRTGEGHAERPRQEPEDAKHEVHRIEKREVQGQGQEKQQQEEPGQRQLEGPRQEPEDAKHEEHRVDKRQIQGQGQEKQQQEEPGQRQLEGPGLGQGQGRWQGKGEEQGQDEDQGKGQRQGQDLDRGKGRGQLLVEEERQGRSEGQRLAQAQRQGLDRTRCVEALKLQLDERANNVSGGFVQSIALARVFIRPCAKVVILDEAMSQMDAVKKREVVQPAIMRFLEKNKATLIVVTHDLSNLQDFDHLVLLDSGKVVAQGSHTDLIKAGVPHYVRLLGHPD